MELPIIGTPDNLDTENTYTESGVTFHNNDGYFNITTQYNQLSTIYTKDTVDLSQYKSIIVKKTSELNGDRIGFMQYPNVHYAGGEYFTLMVSSLGGDFSNFYVADLSGQTRTDLKFFISSYGATGHLNDGDYYLIMLTDKEVADVIADHRFLKKYNK